MGVSPSWLTELTVERDRLLAESQKLHGEGMALLASAGDFNDRAKALTAVITMYGGKTAQPQKSENRPNVAELGFRDAIRHVLLQSETWMKPAAVVKALQESGYKIKEGGLDLKIRVTNELWRMAKRKLIQRSSSKGYTLKTTNPPGASTPEGSYSLWHNQS